tara:strand:- start:959 stop:1411 length:453 start_codon:yes stop_codon:yes gene_type:complete
MNSNRIILTAVIIIACMFFVRNCTYKVGATVPSFQVVQDTITTVVTKINIDTVLVAIEQRLNLAIEDTETTIKEVAREKESLALKIVELEDVENTTYDTVKVTIQVPSDSLMLYNVFEYHSTNGDEVIAMRDTIQSRKVSRRYAQKYIMQ